MQAYSRATGIEESSIWWPAIQVSLHSPLETKHRSIKDSDTTDSYVHPLSLVEGEELCKLWS